MVKKIINENVENADSGQSPSRKQIIITHHVPTNLLIHKRFIGHVANSAFQTNVLDQVPLKCVKMWICGHTHEYADVQVKGQHSNHTTLLVNPVGYPREQRHTRLSLNVWVVD